jgi:hypothetical protein
VGRRAEIWGGGEWDLKHVRQAAAASPSPPLHRILLRRKQQHETLFRSAASFRGPGVISGTVCCWLAARGRCDTSTSGLDLRECPW